jgi:tetratricopeptide (TPR) repeat protein
VLEKQRAILGPAHADTLDTMHNLAMNYGDVDRFAESLTLHEKVLELRKSTYGHENNPAWCLRTFAQVCQRAGKLDEADRLLRDALAHTRKQNDSHAQRLGKANSLGWRALNLLLQQQYATAEPLAREAVAIFEKRRPDDPRRFYWVSVLGDVLLGQKKYHEAETLLLQGYEGMKRREARILAPEKRLLVEAGDRIVHCYEATRQTEKARMWRAKLPTEKSKN